MQFNKEFLIQEQNGEKAVVPSVPEVIKETVRGIIARLRETNLSYEKIGKFYGISKGRVFELEKGWWPTEKDREDYYIYAFFGKSELKKEEGIKA